MASSAPNASTTSTPVSTSCAYESWNATKGCWNYRPCTQCLQTKGCMISSMGLCQDVGHATSQYNYTRAFALNLTLPAAKDTMNDSMRRVDQEWEFPAFEATYCPSDDPVCRLCVQEEFWHSGFKDDSRFCVGANGCVCVMNCEFPITWNPDCGAEYVNPPAQPAPSTKAPVTAPLVTVATDDECQYVSKNDITGCSTYRSCRDCLEKEGCRIGLSGYCEADVWEQGDGEPIYYDLAIRSNMVLPAARATSAVDLAREQFWQFPASRLQYCPINDTICSECVRENYWLAPGQRKDSRFCIGTDTDTDVGKDACVCVANCAREDTATYCSTDFSSGAGDQGSNFVVVFYLLIAGGLVMICLCFGFGRFQKRKRRTRIPIAQVVDDPETTGESGLYGAMYVVVELPQRVDAAP